MRPHAKTRFEGWILMEVLIAMGILAIVLVPMSDLVTQMLRHSGKITARLERVAEIAVAEAAILQLARSGMAPAAICTDLTPRFPDLRFVVDGPVCRAVSREDTDPDGEADQ